MKNVIIISSLALMLFGACKSSQLVSYADDMYASPTEEKRLAKKAQEELAKKEAAKKQAAEEARLLQQAKDDMNPYYWDPEYNQDDYYDYAYASRIRRFSNPIYGAGYYDNFYTNAYLYNQNPYYYGSSIYNSYGWCSMPSNQFNNLSIGISYGYPYNYGYPYYNGYNSLGYGNNYSYWNGYNAGYNNGYYNGYYGYPYGNYSYGYGNYGNNWGYYNSYDVNSQYSKMTYAPRTSNGGGNSRQGTSAGMAVPEGYKESPRIAFFESVVKKQEETPRFTRIERAGKTSLNQGMSPGNTNSSNGQSVNSTSPGSGNPGVITQPNGTRTEGGTPTKKNNGFWNNGNAPVVSDPVNTGNSNNPRSNSRNKRISGETNQTETNSNPTNANRSSNNNGNTNSTPVYNPPPSNTNGGNNNSGTSPRGNNGGGNSRPR